MLAMPDPNAKPIARPRFPLSAISVTIAPKNV